MRNQLSGMNRYELVSLIHFLMEENDTLRRQLEQARTDAEAGCEVNRSLLIKISAALSRMEGKGDGSQQ